MRHVNPKPIVWTMVAGTLMVVAPHAEQPAGEANVLPISMPHGLHTELPEPTEAIRIPQGTQFGSGTIITPPSGSLSLAGFAPIVSIM